MAAPEQHRTEPKESKVVLLRQAGQGVSDSELGEVWFGDGEVRWSDRMRRYYGRNITPDTIEAALRAAEYGYIRDLTDLSYEAAKLDPHLTFCVGKRMRAVASVPPQVVAASGEGVNETRANAYAKQVEQQLKWIPNLRQALTRLTFGHWNGRSLLEKVWNEMPPGSVHKWRIDRLHWVHPRRLAFGPMREMRIRDDLWQGWGWYGTGFERRGFAVDEVPEKFIQFLPQLFNDYPEREGLAPPAMYWAFFKRFDWRQRMQLVEVYSKTWRIVEMDKDAQISKEALERARQTADDLGANASAAMPPGAHLNAFQPAQNAGAIHKEVAAECNDEMSKLILGATRTADAKPDALGGDAARVHQDGEYLNFGSDCVNVADALSEQLAGHFVLMNYGPDELVNAPRIELPFEPPPDHTEEVNRAKIAISFMPLKRSEVYENTGYTMPQPGDDVIEVQVPAGPFGAPPPASPGSEPTPPKLPEPPPSDKTPAPPPAKVDPTPPNATTTPVEVPTAARASGGETVLAAELAREAGVFRGASAARARLGETICCAAQPETVNGSPDSLVESGVKEAARISAGWGQDLADAVGELEDATEIFGALTRAAAALPLGKFARSVERRVLQSLMLGALDSSWEVENDALVGLEKFGVLRPADLRLKELELGDADRKFATRPFDDALKLFKEREVLTKDRFDMLTNAAKRRAFTVAKLAKQELLVAAHSELARQMEAGAAGDVGPRLKDFKKFVTDRIESAGWTPANPSHVETVFRTNVLGGYNAGRHAQMTEPTTLALRPYWQIMAVGDSRTRDTHRKANGTILPASDPFWQKAYAPFGFACRCRVVSRGKSYEGRVTAAPTDLPDEGFESSGTGNLLTADL